MTKTLNILLTLTTKQIGKKEDFRFRFQDLLAFCQVDIPFDIIKVAGTNGKGSVSAMLTAGLVHSNKRVGTFTSPHLVHVKERFRINNKEVEENDIESIAQDVERIIFRYLAIKPSSYTPSFFEVLLLCALLLFKKEKVEIAIFEAGIGGSSDAVSLLPDIVGLITSVGKDHIEKLGPKLEDIASDKAGIVQAGSHLIVNHAIHTDLKKRIQSICQQRGVNYQVSSSLVKNFQTSLDGSEGHLSNEQNLIPITLPLIGSFQEENLNLVISLANWLFHNDIISELKGFLEGLRFTSWPARMERIGQSPQWIIDAAHNEPALLALKKSLAIMSQKDKRILIFGLSLEKEYQIMIPIAAQLANHIFLVDQFYKARTATELQSIFAQLPVPPYTEIVSLEEAVQKSHQHFKEKLVIVTGSIFMIGKARQIILDHVS